MNKSDSITALAAALSLAQGEMEAAKKTSDNPFFKSKYADLAEVIETIREPLAKQGLAISQLIQPDADHAIVESVLMHKSGEWISSIIQLKPVKTDPQGIGSAITYARRYGLGALLNVATEADDDGNAASGLDEQPGQKKVEPPKDKSHWCAIHKTNWFKKGNMQHYAHPCGDGKWCNELPPMDAIKLPDDYDGDFPTPQPSKKVAAPPSKAADSIARGQEWNQKQAEKISKPDENPEAMKRCEICTLEVGASELVEQNGFLKCPKCMKKEV